MHGVEGCSNGKVPEMPLFRLVDKENLLGECVRRGMPCIPRKKLQNMTKQSLDVMNWFSNLWAIIHPPLSTKQGVQHVRHVRQCASGSIKVL